MIAVEKIMSNGVVSTTEETSVIRAADLMKEKEVGCLLIIRKGKLIGIITETDILYKVTTENRNPKTLRVKEIMTSPPITIKKNDSVIMAEAIMERHHIRHLPVMENGKVMGVVSIRDILIPLKHYENLSTHDPLTGLLNRQAFHRALIDEINRSRRFNHPCALLMLDIDRFKKVNDTFGHSAGDKTLKTVSALVRRGIRSVDQMARYGGEEFTLLFPETHRGAALSKAEKIRKTVSRKKIQAGGGSNLSVSVSIGVAVYPEDATGPRDLMEKADKALYAAKKAGRNKVYPLSKSSGPSKKKTADKRSRRLLRP